MDHRRLSASPPPLHDHRCWKIQRSQSWNGERLCCCLTRDMRAISIPLRTAMEIARMPRAWPGGRCAPNTKPSRCELSRHSRASGNPGRRCVISKGWVPACAGMTTVPLMRGDTTSGSGSGLRAYGCAEPLKVDRLGSDDRDAGIGQQPETLGVLRDRQRALAASLSPAAASSMRRGSSGNAS